MKNKILLLDSTHPILSEKLKKFGFEIECGHNMSRGDLINQVHKFTGIVLRSRIVICKEIIDNAGKLEFIARVGSGMESIDVEYCKQKNIKCFNSPEGNRNAVGEHCLGLLLNLLNNISTANKQIKYEQKWDRENNRGTEIKNKTIGIIGYGNTGSAFAEKLIGFNCNIIAYDKYKSGFGNDKLKEVKLNDIFELADVVSLHIPLNKETYYMVNDDFFSKFKKRIFLINTARGPVVKTLSLVNALKNGKLLGVGLDVIEYEETSFEKVENLSEISEFKYLSTADNFIITPHIAGWTHESKIMLADVLAEKIINYYSKSS